MKKICPFCTLPQIQDRKILENELVFACLTYIPITVGHTLILPKRCVATFGEMTAEEQAAVFALREQVCEALRKTFGAEGFNTAWNEGEAAGQSEPHFHLHVVPRTKGDTGIYEYDPRQFLYRPGKRPITPEAELREVAELIKANLARHG
ncbi:MAG: HIT family protein [Candidatus Harrisonbacteria bacterium CG10_big_fil_rev_8_21_14_0_10_49_15]|uniref:HIT family protein n=1 Tax=Candidatus Harrisonbacteria bacterium CG10_big_fil_rev_8_21_14_0_10_49_15 TaxID=1974587 RepID=A0A2H0UKJ5_9BACT|nr:MAG: HIT family protein [Candidatus Harrisonbacteria bacterium CG10_big_fil_rev_8_21_14_0_10_49_15]